MLRWIKKHKLITVLVVVIVATLIVLVSAMSTGGTGNPISNGLSAILTTIEKPFVSVADSISNGVSNAFSSDGLAAENEQLKEEIASLKEKLSKNEISQEELKELRELSNVLKYDFAEDRDIVTADISTYDGVNWTNTFTINVGSASGVKENSIVVYGGALVGRVTSVGENWAKVVSLIDNSSNVSFQVARNSKLLGVVSGSDNARLEGYMLDGDSSVTEGDKILTTGMGIYPKGIEIGTVTEVKYDSDVKLKKVNIEPTVEFTGLKKVTVIK